MVWHLLVSHPALKTSADEVGVGALTEARRAVFLDRDGVLNRAVVVEGKPYPPASVDVARGARRRAEALVSRLKQPGFALIVVTNQPDVARGTQSREAVDALNQHVAPAGRPGRVWRLLPRRQRGGVPAASHGPGMLLDAAARWGIDLDRSASWSATAGATSTLVGGPACRTVFIDYGYREQRPDPARHCHRSDPGGRRDLDRR